MKNLTNLELLMEYMEQNQYFIGNDLLAKYNELLQKEKKEQLILSGVSQQRELLVWLKNKDLVTFTKDEIEEVIDDYKLNQTNCG